MIRPLEINDLPRVKEFTDLAIGDGYFSISELEESLKKSQKDGLTTSFVLENEGKIQGLRLSYPPGKWSKGKGSQLSTHLWSVPVESVGYFQSLFIHSDLMGQAWGQKLSHASIEVMKKLKAKAIVCHSWVESPHNSSGKYLRSIGFQSVALYPHYWKNVDYTCTRCGRPCSCTAEEMILYL